MLCPHPTLFSVAYCLSLLGHFVLESGGVQNNALAQGIAIALVAGIGFLGWSGGADKVSGVERYATALNLAVIGGFSAALLAYNFELLSAGHLVLSSAENWNSNLFLCCWAC